jgi:hypothetical protein
LSTIETCGVDIESTGKGNIQPWAEIYNLLKSDKTKTMDEINNEVEETEKWVVDDLFVWNGIEIADDLLQVSTVKSSL